MKFSKYNGLFEPFMEANGNAGGGTAGNTVGDPNSAAGAVTQTAAVDYDKIQKMLDGTLAAKEDTALKAYFKQQGLSQEEMGQAIAAFKEQKAKNTPNISAIQQQAAQAQQDALNAQIEKESIMLSPELGVELKVMPYLIKMADVKDVIENGEINKEKLKEALNKVLDDIPQLKKSTDPSGAGGFKFGSSGNGNSNTSNDDALKAAFGL